MEILGVRVSSNVTVVDFRSVVEITGDLSGTSFIQGRTYITDNGTRASTRAASVCTCTVAGRSGQVALSLVARASLVDPSSNREALTLRGVSGQLEGLVGTLTGPGVGFGTVGTSVPIFGTVVLP